MGAITGNEMLFQGEEYCRVPTTNVLELEKQTYKHVGEMFSVSIMYGGPAPIFLAPSITDYIIFGLKGVKACVDEIPCFVIKENLKNVLNGMIGITNAYNRVIGSITI